MHNLTCVIHVISEFTISCKNSTAQLYTPEQKHISGTLEKEREKERERERGRRERERENKTRSLPATTRLYTFKYKTSKGSSGHAQRLPIY